MLASSRLALSLACFSVAFAVSAQTPTQSQKFVENKGQWNSEAKFLARMPGLNLWITNEGPVLDFRQFTRTNKVAANPKLDRPEGILKGQVVKMRFTGGLRGSTLGITQVPELNNYLGSASPIKGARSYKEALLQNIYRGVDARYYFDRGSPRYDLIVKRGADPKQIAMKFEGADRVVALSNGDLRLETSLGSVVEGGLTVYQGEGRNRTLVAAKMEAHGNSVCFRLGSYDKSKDLVIDPIIYSSFIGGTGQGTVGDKVLAVSDPVTASPAYQYIAGNAESSDFPTTTGTYQKTKNIGGQGFVAQINSKTGAVIWCTFIQGQSLNANALLEVTSVVANPEGDAVIAGGVENESIYTSSGAFQNFTDINPNLYSGFIMDVYSNGKSIPASTYLAGTTSDTFVLAVNLSKAGNILATGRTKATDFPVTAHGVSLTNKSANGGISGTAFATVLSSNLTSVSDSTYLGGSGADIGYAIAASTGDNIVVVGTTSSTDFPVLVGCYQLSNKAANGTTGFVTTLKADVSQYVASSYFGGNTYDSIYAMYVDSSANIFIGGSTSSTNLPVGINFQGTLKGPQNGFVAELTADEKSPMRLVQRHPWTFQPSPEATS